MFAKKIIFAFAILKALPFGTDTNRTLQSVSEELGISLSYAEQLAKPLRDAGWIKGVRGPGGGCWRCVEFDEIKLVVFYIALYGCQPKLWLPEVRLSDLEATPSNKD